MRNRPAHSSYLARPRRRTMPEEEASIHLKMAQAPHAAPDHLAKVAHSILHAADEWELNDVSWNVLSAIAAHPNTPVEILIRCMWHAPDAVLANPVLPLLALEHPDFVEQINRDVLGQLLQRPDVPAAFVRLCGAHSSETIAEAARGHIVLAPEYDPTGPEWESVALDALARLPVRSWEGFWELIEYGLLPRELTDRLGYAAVHPPEHPEARAFAERCREAAAAPPRGTENAPTEPTTGGWESLAVNDPDRLLTLARDPRTPPDTLRAFRRAIGEKAPATDDSRTYYDVVECLVQNVSTPPDVLASCVSPVRESHLIALASHPNATPELLRETVRVTVEHRRDTLGLHWIVCAVLSHPAVTPEVAQEAVRYTIRQPLISHYLPLYNRLLRWHPFLAEAPPEFPPPDAPVPDNMFRAWANQYSSLEYVLYLMMTEKPRPVAPWLGNDAEPPPIEWEERFAAALNVHVPRRMRERLANDGHRLVRAAARARLAAPRRPLLGIPGPKGKA